MGQPLLLSLFVASAIPVVKIVLICGIGALCARKGLLSPEGRRVLGSLSFLVFNPCLCFVKLASTLTPSRMLHWWPLILNTALSTAVGLGLGYLGVGLLRPACPQHLRPHTVVCIALGNLGNLPLVIVSSLANSASALLSGIPAGRAEDLAVSYVVVGLLVPVIVHATIGFSMLRKPHVAVLPAAGDDTPRATSGPEGQGKGPGSGKAPGMGSREGDGDDGDGEAGPDGTARVVSVTTPRLTAAVAAAASRPGAVYVVGPGQREHRWLVRGSRWDSGRDGGRKDQLPIHHHHHHHQQHPKDVELVVKDGACTEPEAGEAGPLAVRTREDSALERQQLLGPGLCGSLSEGQQGLVVVAGAEGPGASSSTSGSSSWSDGNGLASRDAAGMQGGPSPGAAAASLTAAEAGDDAGGGEGLACGGCARCASCGRLRRANAAAATAAGAGERERPEAVEGRGGEGAGGMAGEDTVPLLRRPGPQQHVGDHQQQVLSQQQHGGQKVTHGSADGGNAAVPMQTHVGMHAAGDEGVGRGSAAGGLDGAGGSAHGGLPALRGLWVRVGGSTRGAAGSAGGRRQSGEPHRCSLCGTVAAGGVLGGMEPLDGPLGGVIPELLDEGAGGRGAGAGTGRSSGGWGRGGGPGEDVEEGRLLGSGGGAGGGVESSSSCALPPLAGARVVRQRGPAGWGHVLRSASGRRTLARLGRSSSGRHVLLEWHAKIDYRAVARHVWREATSPPLLAILLSVPVGCAPPLRRALFGDPLSGQGAPLALVTDVLRMLGDCTIPAILVILGATLANGPGAAPVPLRLIGLVTAARLLLLPLLGLGLVMGAYALRLFPAPDPIYLLVLLIQNTAPTAIMVHTMASVQGNRSEEVSAILFWGYMLGILVIPLWLTLFLYAVQQMYRGHEDV